MRARPRQRSSTFLVQQGASNSSPNTPFSRSILSEMRPTPAPPSYTHAHAVCACTRLTPCQIPAAKKLLKNMRLGTPTHDTKAAAAPPSDTKWSDLEDVALQAARAKHPTPSRHRWRKVTRTFREMVSPDEGTASQRSPRHLRWRWRWLQRRARRQRRRRVAPLPRVHASPATHHAPIQQGAGGSCCPECASGVRGAFFPRAIRTLGLEPKAGPHHTKAWVPRSKKLPQPTTSALRSTTTRPATLASRRKTWRRQDSTRSFATRLAASRRSAAMGSM